MNIKMSLFILLLSTTNNFCGEKQKTVPSLKDICFNLCKDDISEPTVSIEKTIKPVFQSLQKNEHRDELFKLLEEKKHPYVIKTIDFYKNQYRENPFDDNGLNGNHADLLDLHCRKIAFGCYYTKLQTSLPIQIKGDWQKTSFKVDNDGNIFLLTMPITGPDNYSSVNQFYASKNIATCNPVTLQTNPLSSRPYNVKEELYREKHQVYPNEPFYNPGKDKVHESKGNWLKNHQLTNCLDIFPNNVLVMTHAWGGIELIQPDQQIRQLLVKNSISTISCSSDNQHIALGSYDGRVTIIDTQKFDNQEPELTCFKEYYHKKKYGHANYPKIITSCKLPEENTITALQYCPEEENIFFSADNSLYCMQTTSSNVSSTPDCLFTSQSPITHFTQINNVIICISGKKITVLDLATKQEISSVDNSHHITSICPYITENNNCFITGDIKGNVIIWNIRKTEFTINMILQHNAPIYQVEVTKDNKYIGVKLTEEIEKSSGWITKKDKIIFYPTPIQLQECVEKQSNLIESINTQFKDNYNNPTALYKLLSDNQLRLYNSNNEHIINLKDTIENRIIEYLQSDDFAKSINSVNKLAHVFCSYPSTDFRKPQEFTISGTNTPEKINLLRTIDNKISKTLKNFAIPFLTEEFDRNSTRENQINIYALSYNLFWPCFHNVRHGHNQLQDLPAALGTLIGKLMIIHDIEQPNKNDSMSYYKARATYFLTQNTRTLIGTAVSIPLAWLAYKYFSNAQ